MNGNEDTNIGSSRSVSAVAAATMVHKGSKVQKTFDERFKDLCRLKQSLGVAMRLEHGQETIRTFLWGFGAII